MGYDRGDSFPVDFEPNGIPFGFPFGSKSKGKLSPRSYPIQFERKLKYSFISVRRSRLTSFSITVPSYEFPDTAGTSRHYGITGFAVPPKSALQIVSRGDTNVPVCDKISSKKR